MKKTFRFVPLSLLLIASVASPVRADECKKIHARIIVQPDHFDSEVRGELCTP